MWASGSEVTPLLDCAEGMAGQIELAGTALPLLYKKACACSMRALLAPPETHRGTVVLERPEGWVDRHLKSASRSAEPDLESAV